MKLQNTYQQILTISLPIMLGGAAQNLIVLTDNVFLYHRSSLEFASIGLIGVFYLVIAAMGYGFSRGGQIIIARRYGESDTTGVGKSTVSLFYLELLFASIIFIFIQCYAEEFLAYFINDPAVLTKCLLYIYPRSYGLFFSFTGVALIGLYTAIAKTKFVIWDTLLLVTINLVLNYCLIFGKFGLPEMGIVGAAWASTIAEIVAFIVFVIYFFYEGAFKRFRMWHLLRPDLKDINNMLRISFPIVLQAVIGIGSWFVFFSIIENLGQRSLEVSNRIRNVYLILSVPCWGYAAGINTLVSNFMGYQGYDDIMSIIRKTTFLSLISSLMITLPVILLPEYSLYPLFGSEDMSIMYEAGSLFWILLFIMIAFSVGGVIISGLVGTGATMVALYIQGGMAILYVIAAHYIVNVRQLSLEWAWGIEVGYWLLIIVITIAYLRSGLWQKYTV